MAAVVLALLAGSCAVTETAKYLLRAPAPDMQRWMAQAAERRVTFAEYIRALLYANENGSDPPVEAASSAERLGPDGDEAASTGGSPPEPSSSPDPGSGPPVEPSEEPAATVQTPIEPPAPPDLLDEARRLAAKMRV